MNPERCCVVSNRECNTYASCSECESKDERYTKLREGLLHKYTLQELVDELSKRKGVTTQQVKLNNEYPDDCGLPKGPATILVIKK
jgi:hypothetical protein